MSHVQRAWLAFVAAVLWVAPIDAQPPGATKPYRIGVLTGGGSSKLLQEGLHDLGYVEGRDIVLEVRNAEGKSERLDALASELVRLKVDVIVAGNPSAVLSAKRATATVPIVMMHTPDPVHLGIVSNLARPDANITGVTTLSADLSVKQLGILMEAVPRLSRVALLWNPDNPWHRETIKALQSNSDAIGLRLQVLQVRGPDAFDGAFQAMAAERSQAVLVLVDPMTYFHRRRLAELAIRHRLPMMGGLSDYAEAGSLLSYWADATEVNHRVVSYVDRILKGARPGDLPIEQPTKFEIVANLRTAKALGFTFPQSVLLRVNRVIE